MAIQDLDLKIKRARAAGYSDEQITNFLRSKGENITLPPEQSVMRDALHSTAEGIRSATEFIGGGFNELASKANQALGIDTQGKQMMGKIGEVIQPAVQAYEENVPQPVKDIVTVGNVALPLGRASGVLPSVSSVASRFTKAKTVDEIIDIVDAQPVPSATGKESFNVPDSPSLAKVKSEAPVMTAKEKFAGVRPDIKARIQGKEDQLKSYFDVAEARNLSDQAPYPFEVGARRVDLAQQKLESILDDTGGKIGQFRKKIATYKAFPEDITAIDDSFLSNLSKLNLEVRNGSIVKQQGKIAKTVNDAEINTLQSLYDDFLTYKKSPTVENAIALRDKFNNKINFAKSSQEVSGNIDPLSRAVRAKIKEVASKQVGKSEAKNLDDYARLMEALSELKSYTDRRAGGEFLIKQVLSERGGDSRAIIETIKNETGIDLMDDAVMARLATDIVGNDAQKGLFRQEITRAGLDAKALATGDVKGIISAIYQRGADWLIDPKEVYLESARSKPLPKQSSPKKQQSQPSQKPK